MKAKLILINFIASWFGLSIDTEYSPLWACLIAVAWFLASGILFLRATRRGDYKDIEKHFKIDGL
ncbi:hypothetical protein SAMN05216357_11294 [Porphyromonadaceae bacterium KH3CP3RA]|nr:hypothetical protein SAMN05216357_11294 [Porphyromonadaceae bacterium KH3CP3RA]